MSKDKSQSKQASEPDLAGYQILQGLELVLKKKVEITEVCKSFNVERLDLFGSAVNGEFHDTSDYDFLVRFQSIPLHDYFENFIGFQVALEKLLGRNVDLIEAQTLKNPYLIQSIEKEKLNIYEGKKS